MAVLNRSTHATNGGLAAFLNCTLLVLATLLIGAPRVTSAAAPRGEYAEYQVKAAFLLNFARYVEWPMNAVTPAKGEFVIGVLGSDPFGASIDQIASGKIVNGQRVVVRRVGTVGTASACHIVFVADPEKSSTAKIMQHLKAKPVLTVSDAGGFLEQGGIILLKRRQDMIRFDLNLQAADAAGLKISSKLLKLADNYRDK